MFFRHNTNETKDTIVVIVNNLIESGDSPTGDVLTLRKLLSYLTFIKDFFNKCDQIHFGHIC